MKNTSDLIIATDLDGTLLDHDTYSFGAASEALHLLAARDVPLLICSSKTRAEIERLRQDLRNRHPFISENGGALFIPRGYFSFRLGRSRSIAGYDVIEFGTPYYILVEALHQAARLSGVEVIGFSDMTIEELAADCGLTLPEARLAKLREYDEPFRVATSGRAALERLFEALHRQGPFRCIRGDRYYHLTGMSDKAIAVRTLKKYYRRERSALRMAGLGDGPNDVAMLREVDVPVIVRNPAADSASLFQKVPNARLTRAAGPAGWNEAVLELLAQVPRANALAVDGARSA